VEARADFEERADSAPQDGLAFGRVSNAREDLKQCALAGTVPPDDAEDLAALDFEVDVLESPEGLLWCPQAPECPDGVAYGVRDALREGFVGPVHPDLVLLGEVFHFDDGALFLGCHVTPGPRSTSLSGGGR